MPRPRILFLDAYDSFSNNITSLLATLLDADVFVLRIDDPLLFEEDVVDGEEEVVEEDDKEDGRVEEKIKNHNANDNAKKVNGNGSINGHCYQNGSHTTSATKTRSRNRTTTPSPRLLARELARYDALVCGPGPGHPANPVDVGAMRLVWQLAEQDLLPVLGVCLGFQSLVAAFGGTVGRLRRGLHGMVRGVGHCGLSSPSEEEGGKGGGGGDIFRRVGPFKATLYHSLCGDVGQDEIPLAEWESGRTRFQPTGRCPELVPLAWVEERHDEDGLGGVGSGGVVERILMAVRHRTKPFWGLQYHPESVCTEAEGNKVILNWLRAAQRWNEKRGRAVVRDGPALARAARKMSLLSQLAVQLPPSSSERRWFEVVGTNPTLRSVTVPLPEGVEVPDIVEAVDDASEERILLDSANASPAASRADVRGRFSIVAVGVDRALRVEHHVGDGYATLRYRGGESGGRSEQVSLAPYGGIWGLIAALHEARRLPSGAAGPESTTPFVGGFMGYITYEQGLHDIGIPLDQPRDHHRPDVSLAWVTRSVVVDHAQKVMHIQQLCSDTVNGEEEEEEEDKTTWLNSTAALLRNLKPTPSPLKNGNSPSPRPTITTPDPAAYESKVRACQEYIAAGDSYELCLTEQTTILRPITTTTTTTANNNNNLDGNDLSPPSLSSSSSGWTLFKTLRHTQPAPFASYLRLGSATLVSASPERFLTFSRAGVCEMRPMKGTVRKSSTGDGITTAATLEQAERILHVPKEEAENLMIVDLVRHDLHGVCGAGRVSVPDLLRVEEYESVFQMITVVEGRLPEGGSGDDDDDGGGVVGEGEGEEETGERARKRRRFDTTNGTTTTNNNNKKEKKQKTKYTGLDVLSASLPPGSMTGAPKKRSCEILREIEGRHRERSLYSGVVGYMCATGRGDWSVTIRSLFRWDDEQQVVVVTDEGGGGEEKRVVNEVWRVGAGGAVTILSTPEGEREEMFVKLAGPLGVFKGA
ncbi:hypothetical protein VTJ04DRAFT_6136 [Mycothermus thermophilus]|uniref:uncharacterized protein n=1 Tax=Humicola insolens TaxID=85995 RepID=UPI003742D745